MAESEASRGARAQIATTLNDLSGLIRQRRGDGPLSPQAQSVDEWLVVAVDDPPGMERVLPYIDRDGGRRLPDLGIRPFEPTTIASAFEVTNVSTFSDNLELADGSDLAVLGLVQTITAELPKVEWTEAEQRGLVPRRVIPGPHFNETLTMDSWAQVASELSVNVDGQVLAAGGEATPAQLLKLVDDAQALRTLRTGIWEPTFASNSAQLVETGQLERTAGAALEAVRVHAATRRESAAFALADLSALVARAEASREIAQRALPQSEDLDDFGPDPDVPALAEVNEQIDTLHEIVDAFVGLNRESFLFVRTTTEAPHPAPEGSPRAIGLDASALVEVAHRIWVELETIYNDRNERVADPRTQRNSALNAMVTEFADAAATLIPDVPRAAADVMFLGDVWPKEAADLAVMSLASHMGRSGAAVFGPDSMAPLARVAEAIGGRSELIDGPVIDRLTALDFASALTASDLDASPAALAAQSTRVRLALDMLAQTSDAWAHPLEGDVAIVQAGRLLLKEPMYRQVVAEQLIDHSLAHGNTAEALETFEAFAAECRHTDDLRAHNSDYLPGLDLSTTIQLTDAQLYRLLWAIQDHEQSTQQQQVAPLQLARFAEALSGERGAHWSVEGYNPSPLNDPIYLSNSGLRAQVTDAAVHGLLQTDNSANAAVVDRLGVLASDDVDSNMRARGLAIKHWRNGELGTDTIVTDRALLELLTHVAGASSPSSSGRAFQAFPTWMRESGVDEQFRSRFAPLTTAPGATGEEQHVAFPAGDPNQRARALMTAALHSRLVDDLAGVEASESALAELYAKQGALVDDVPTQIAVSTYSVHATGSRLERRIFERRTQESWQFAGVARQQYDANSAAIMTSLMSDHRAAHEEPRQDPGSLESPRGALGSTRNGHNDGPEIDGHGDDDDGRGPGGPPINGPRGPGGTSGPPGGRAVDAGDQGSRQSTRQSLPASPGEGAQSGQRAQPGDAPAQPGKRHQGHESDRPRTNAPAVVVPAPAIEAANRPYRQELQPEGGSTVDRQRGGDHPIAPARRTPPLAQPATHAPHALAPQQRVVQPAQVSSKDGTRSPGVALPRSAQPQSPGRADNGSGAPPQPPAAPIGVAGVSSKGVPVAKAGADITAATAPAVSGGEVQQRLAPALPGPQGPPPMSLPSPG